MKKARYTMILKPFLDYYVLLVTYQILHWTGQRMQCKLVEGQSTQTGSHIVVTSSENNVN